MIPIKKSKYICNKIDKVEQEIKVKLDRSASKLDRPTAEMAGLHQASAFSRKILLVSKSIVVAVIGIDISFSCFVLGWTDFRACHTNSTVISGIQYAVQYWFVAKFCSWEENL